MVCGLDGCFFGRIGYLSRNDLRKGDQRGVVNVLDGRRSRSQVNRQSYGILDCMVRS